MKHLTRQSSIFVVTSLFVALVLAGCGGGSSATAIPTSTIIPTYNFLTPTPFAAIETAVATTTVETTAEATTVEATTAAVDSDIVTRGKARYDALNCASCHGANGEGTDKAKALIPFTMSEGDFVTFMRSGGTIGPTHQYATNRLSISGGTALYQYLLSLQKSS
jgi:mono/diheme cytochrome c family protein